MPLFIAVAAIDPARNELTRAFVRDTQDAAEAMAAANTSQNLPWVVFELVECSKAEATVPRVTRSRTVLSTAGAKDADSFESSPVRSDP